MNKERFEVIDNIRGLSIIGMIFIHVAYLYKTSEMLREMVNASQFVVVSFIFCSAYLFYQKETHLEVRKSVDYFKKRLSRLLIPYYIFLPFLIGALLFSDKKLVTTNFVLSLLTMSLPYPFWDWLIAIFLMLAVLMPFVFFLLKKHRGFFIGFTIMSTLSTVLFLFYRPQFNFKFVMWLPWMFVVLCTWFFIAYKEKREYFTEVFLFTLFVVFLLSKSVLLYFNKTTLQHFENKFPPNMYHISYGLLVTGLLYVFFRKVSLPRTLSKALHYLSKYSYSIFFIHVVFLHLIGGFIKRFFQLGIPWTIYFGVLVGVTIITRVLMNYLFSALKRGPTI